MNVASTCKAEVVSVKLCFFVKVLNASGRRVAGGSTTGRTLVFAGCCGAGLNGRMGCAGVANAGLDEGIGFAAGRGVNGCLKIGAAFVGFGKVSDSAILKRLNCVWRRCVYCRCRWVENHFRVRRV